MGYTLKRSVITPQITKRTANIKRYLSEIKDFPVLGAKEEISFINRARAGDARARMILINCNLKLAFSTAKMHDKGKIPFDELVLYANEGLIIGIDSAIKLWDATRGFKLMSYVIYSVRQRIENGIQFYTNTVHLPLDKVRQISKRKKLVYDIEYIQEMPITWQTVKDAFETAEESIDRYMLVYENRITHFSMDVTPWYSPEACAVVLVQNQFSTEDTADHICERESLYMDILRTLNTLSEREADVLALYYGFPYKSDLLRQILVSRETQDWFNDPFQRNSKNQGLTLEEIGKLIRLIPERVRQIKEKALRRLRTNKRSMLLQKYLG